MPIDTSIFGRIRGVTVPSPLEPVMNGLALKNQMQAGQMNDIKLQEAQQGQADQAVLRQEAEVAHQILFKNHGDIKASLSEMAAKTPHIYQQYATANAAQEKESQALEASKATTAKTQAETTEITRKAALPVETAHPPGSHVTVRMPDGTTKEYDVPEASRNIDPNSPAGIEAAKQKALDLRNMPPLPTAPTPPLSDARFNQEKELAAKRAELAAANRVDPEQVFNYVDKADGQLKVGIINKRTHQVEELKAPTGESIGPASGAAKPPTAAERKMLGFYDRVSPALDAIDGMEGEIAKMSGSLFDQTLLRYAPNFLQTSLGKRFTQAKNDFINASLRRESGAAISDGEYKHFDEIYFPQPGDDGPGLAQKKRARDVQLGTFKTESGKAFTEKYGDDTKPAPGAPPKPAAPAEKVMTSEQISKEMRANSQYTRDEIIKALEAQGFKRPK